MNNSGNIPVLAKAIRVLTALATEAEPATPSELARRLGLAQATCYRIVRTYEQAGWVRRHERGGFVLAPALTSLLDGLGPHHRLAEVATPILQQLADKTNLTAKLSIRSGHEAVTLLRCDPPEPMLVTGGAGTCFHLCYGSSGVSASSDLSPQELQNLIDEAPKEVWLRQKPADFLAQVASCQRQGYSLDRGSYHPDVHSVSAPLVIEGKVVGALTLLALPNDLPEKRIAPLAGLIKAASWRCAELMGVDQGKLVEDSARRKKKGKAS